MKTKIVVEPESKEQAEAIVNALENQELIDGIYDAVFRPVIKYGQNEKEVEAFEMVWNKLSEYLYE